MAAKVYIVLVNWNGAQDTLECLETVLRLDYPDFQVIVCDNDSQDWSVENILAWAGGEGAEVSAQNPLLDHLVRPNVSKPVSVEVLSRVDCAEEGRLTSSARIIVIRTGANLGFAGANNIGMNYGVAAGDASYFWLLNNDTAVDPGALTALVSRSQVANDQGIVGSTLIFYNNIGMVQAMGVGKYCKTKALSVPLGIYSDVSHLQCLNGLEIEANADFVVGASMLISSKLLKEVGFMAENYFLYFEELDWAIRAKSLGYRSMYARDSFVYHKVGSSTARIVRNDLPASVRFSYNNRIMITGLYFKNELVLVRIRILVEGLRLLLGGRFREGFFAVKISFRRVVP